LLRQRIGNREVGKLVGRPDRVKLAEYKQGEDGKEKLVGGLRAIAEEEQGPRVLRSSQSR